MNEELDNLFLQAREIADPAKPAAFLDQACAHAPALCQRVERILADESRTEAFFTEADTVAPTAQTELVPPPAPLASTSELEGRTIWRYKLLQKIGNGGFGSVWMAEQTEPVRCMVALKIIRRGMDNPRVCHDRSWYIPRPALSSGNTEAWIPGSPMPGQNNSPRPCPF